MNRQTDSSSRNLDETYRGRETITGREEFPEELMAVNGTRGVGVSLLREDTNKLPFAQANLLHPRSGKHP